MFRTVCSHSLGSCNFRGVWATCLEHKGRGVPLSPLSKDTTTELAGLLSTTSPKCERQAGKLWTLFLKSFGMARSGLNLRSTDCEADALTTTPSVANHRSPRLLTTFQKTFPRLNGSLTSTVSSLQGDSLHSTVQVTKQFQSWANRNEKLLLPNKKVGGEDACILFLATKWSFQTTCHVNIEGKSFSKTCNVR